MRFRVWVTFRRHPKLKLRAGPRDRAVYFVRPGCSSYPIESSRSCGQGWKGS